jgi:hypothetical protein
MTVETAVLATNRCLLHFAKNGPTSLQYASSLPGAGLSPFSGDAGWGTADGPGEGPLVLLAATLSYDADIARVSTTLRATRHPFPTRLARSVALSSG